MSGRVVEGPWLAHHPSSLNETRSSRPEWFCGTISVRSTHPGDIPLPLVPESRSAVVYHVYILASSTGVLYAGVTNHLERRTGQHKQGLVPGFTSKYGIHRLVYYEPHGDVRIAIAREKQIKRWRREKKLALIRSANPELRDLSEDFSR